MYNADNMSLTVLDKYLMLAGITTDWSFIYVITTLTYMLMSTVILKWYLMMLTLWATKKLDKLLEPNYFSMALIAAIEE